MENFLKRISFFLIYLPALIFSCQFAYYTGLCKPLDVYISTLGMNYSEVTFLGYLTTSNLILEIFNELMLLFLYLVLYLIVAAMLYFLAVHPSKRKNETYKVEVVYYQALYNILEWKNILIKFMNSFSGYFLIYFSIFIFTILTIVHFYEKGKKEIIDEFYRIDHSTICEYREGYVTLDNKRIRTEQMLCGNNKCYGIDLDKKEIFTYLPENFHRPLFLSKSVKR